MQVREGRGCSGRAEVRPGQRSPFDSLGVGWGRHRARLQDAPIRILLLERSVNQLRGGLGKLEAFERAAGAGGQRFLTFTLDLGGRELTNPLRR